MELSRIYKQTQLKQIVSSDIKADMLSHCYLLSGVDSVLLNAFAELVAKEIYCEGSEAPCGECINCRKISHSNMVDLITYPKGDKGLVVDDITEIVSDCYIKPVESVYKVYILKDFDNATIQAQNKILKTLEEPPRNVVFILTTTSIGLVLPTIISRAKKIDVALLSADDIGSILESEKLPNTREINLLSGGNLTTALSLVKSKDNDAIISLAFETLEKLSSSQDILLYSSRILGYKKILPLFLNLLLSILRDIVVEDRYRAFSERESSFKVLKNKYSPESVSKISSHIITTMSKMEFNCNFTGLVDELLLKILEVRFLCQR